MGRPANYGSRIDLILCTPGLQPWIKGGDIMAKVFGSDHCPVYIDLHDSIPDPINPDSQLLLRDMLNPKNRPLTTAMVYPTDPPREAPEPPRFATKFFEEFSGRQQTLKSFFGGKRKLVSPSPTPTPTFTDETKGTPDEEVSQPVPVVPKVPEETLSTPFSRARAAFSTLEAGPSSASSQLHESQPAGRSDRNMPSSSKRRRTSDSIDLTTEEDIPRRPLNGQKQFSDTFPSGKTKPTKANSTTASQPTLASFFAPPKSKVPQNPSPPPPYPPPPKRISISKSPPSSLPPLESTNLNEDFSYNTEQAEEEDALIAQAIAEADAEKEEKRQAKNAEAGPIWSNLFAKKLPPLCTVHQVPCKDFSESSDHRSFSPRCMQSRANDPVVKIPGPNKGKRFWLCSL